MNIRSLTVLALCAGIPMLAQTPGLTAAKGDTEVTVYGILDVGVGTVAHSFGFDPNFPVGVNPQAIKFADTSATGMFNGGISQTRWGIKGSTGLTDGWKAVFTLEGAINVPSGAVSNGALGLSQNYASSATVASSGTSADTAINGQLFSRGAYFGISSDTYGTLTAGRHMSFMLETIPGYDALQGAQIFTPIGFSGSYGGGGATDSSRVDNALRYKLKVGDVNVALMHKFGGATGSSTARSANEFQLGYEHGPFGIQFLYQTYKDATSVGNPAGTAAAPLGTIAVTYYDTTSYMAIAKYKVGDLAIKGGYQKQKFTNPSDPAIDLNTTTLYGYVASSVSVTPYNVTVNGAVISAEKDLDVMWLGLAYDVTKAFSVAVGYYDIKQNDWSYGTQPTGGTKVAGTSKFVSALLDYRFTKAFDVYLGYMKNTVADSLAFGYTNDNNAVLGLGARLVF